MVNIFIESYFQVLKWCNIGLFCGGCFVVVCGVFGDLVIYYMGIIGGGFWKIMDAGQYWNNIFDGFFKMGFVGVVVVVFSDFNVVYVGMGEYVLCGVMIIYGDGVYKFIDVGKIWQYLGLEFMCYIVNVVVYFSNFDIVYVVV